MTPTSTTLGRLGLLGALYFAQGLPYGFFFQALPVLLRQQGHSLDTIGWTSLLALPWALKFLWAPVVDRRWWPRLGRRRSWILAMQLAGSVTLAVLAAIPGAGSVTVLMAAMIVLNLIAATQDIATDGLAIDILAVDERGVANGLQVAGYRVGMVIGGGVLLGLHDQLGIRGTFAAMAVLTVLASLPVLAATEPPPAAPPARPELALHFLHRPGVARLLALILVYKVGEAFAQGMLRPFLVDNGLDLEDIGWLLGTVGFAAGMAGALAGGALVGRLGRRRALVGFGIGQVITVAGYLLLSLEHPSLVELYAWCGVEHFASGAATAALFTCMMDWSERHSSATDYTVQASAVVIATGVAGIASGYSAHALGYTVHFALATALCIVAVVLAGVLFPRESTT
jgi:MFS transporter, PAT family, beta-lactamase induction signal transducer AmpG